jgi:hypothetical protein
MYLSEYFEFVLFRTSYGFPIFAEWLNAKWRTLTSIRFVPNVMKLLRTVITDDPDR